MVRGIRGATTVDNNTKEDILAATKELLISILSENDIDNQDIVSIMFTATKDLDKGYPAVGARELGLTDVPLTCVQEMHVEGSLDKCIRILLTVNSDKNLSEIRHIFQKGAVVLRPDLIKK